MPGVQRLCGTIQDLLDEGSTGDTGTAQAKALPCNTSSALLQAEIDGSQAGDQDALDFPAMDMSAASGRQLQSLSSRSIGPWTSCSRTFSAVCGVNQKSACLANRRRVAFRRAAGPGGKDGGIGTRAARAFFPVIYRRRRVDAGAMSGKTAMAWSRAPVVSLLFTGGAAPMTERCLAKLQ